MPYSNEDPMILTQNLVNWAKGNGYKMRALALYEKRLPTEVFINPNNQDKVVFHFWMGFGETQYLNRAKVVESWDTIYNPTKLA